MGPIFGDQAMQVYDNYERFALRIVHCLGWCDPPVYVGMLPPLSSNSQQVEHYTFSRGILGGGASQGLYPWHILGDRLIPLGPLSLVGFYM